MICAHAGQTLSLITGKEVLWFPKLTVSLGGRTWSYDGEVERTVQVCYTKLAFSLGGRRAYVLYGTKPGGCPTQKQPRTNPAVNTRNKLDPVPPPPLPLTFAFLFAFLFTRRRSSKMPRGGHRCAHTIWARRRSTTVRFKDVTPNPPPPEVFLILFCIPHIMHSQGQPYYIYRG